MGQDAENNQRPAEQLGDRILILFIAIAVVAGGFTSTLFLYLVNGIWNRAPVLIGISLVVNLLFAFVVYNVFSRSHDQTFLERALVVGMNVVGLIFGVYLFLT